MSAHVTYEVNPTATGSFVVEVTVEAERPKVPLKLAAKQWCGLPTASIAGFLATKEDQISVGARS